MRQPVTWSAACWRRTCGTGLQAARVCQTMSKDSSRRLELGSKLRLANLGIQESPLQSDCACVTQSRSLAACTRPLHCGHIQSSLLLRHLGQLPVAHSRSINLQTCKKNKCRHEERTFTARDPVRTGCVWACPICWSTSAILREPWFSFLATNSTYTHFISLCYDDTISHQNRKKHIVT